MSRRNRVCMHLQLILRAAVGPSDLTVDFVPTPFYRSAQLFVDARSLYCTAKLIRSTVDMFPADTEFNFVMVIDAF